jgi:hypothetical protein
MKNFLKANLILSGIFVTTTSVFTGSISVAQTPDNDPNLAVAPSAAASSAMQTDPIQLKTPSAPGATGAVATTSAAAAAPTEPKELTNNQFYAFSFALKNIDGVVLDKDKNVVLVPKIWRQPLKLEGVDKYTSEDRNQFLDFGLSNDGRSDVITYDKAKARATVTIFKNNQPESYTIVGKHGEYTATPGLCEILRAQTNSNSFEDLKDKAVTCKSFYNRTKLDDSTKAAMQSTVQVALNAHRRNMSLLKDSVAKPLAEAALKKVTTGLNWRSWFSSSAKKIEPIDVIKPRPILTSDSSASEVDDRNALSELAEACGNLWKDADSGPSAQPAKTRAKSAAPGAVRK